METKTKAITGSVLAFLLVMTGTYFMISTGDKDFYYEKNHFTVEDKIGNTIYDSTYKLYFDDNSITPKKYNKYAKWVRYDMITRQDYANNTYIEAPMRKQNGMYLTRFFYISKDRIKEGAKVECPGTKCYLEIIYKGLVCDRILDNTCYVGNDVVVNWDDSIDVIKQVTQQKTQLKITTKKYADEFYFDPEVVIGNETNNTTPNNCTKLINGTVIDCNNITLNDMEEKIPITRLIKEDFNGTVNNLVRKNFTHGISEDDPAINSEIIETYYNDYFFVRLNMSDDYKVRLHTNDGIKEPVSYHASGFEYLVAFNYTDFPLLNDTSKVLIHVGATSDVFYVHNIPEREEVIAYYYPNNDNTVMIDDSVNGTQYNGSAVGGPIFSQNGNTSAEVRLDGVDDYLAVTHDIGDLSTTDMTISVWLNYTDDTGVQTTIQNWESNQQWIIYKNGGNLVCGIHAASAVVSQTFTDIGNYHHVAFTFNSSNKSVRMYVDGALVDTGSTAAPAVGSNSEIILGQNGGSNFAEVGISNFVLYHKMLNSTEIADINDTGRVFYNVINETDVTITLNSPANGAVNLSRPVTLNVTASNNKGSNMTVTFLQKNPGANNFSIISAVNSTNTTDTVTYSWTGLSSNTTYNWTVNVSLINNVSVYSLGSNWYFTTNISTFSTNTSTGFNEPLIYLINFSKVTSQINMSGNFTWNTTQSGLSAFNVTGSMFTVNNTGGTSAQVDLKNNQDKSYYDWICTNESKSISTSNTNIFNVSSSTVRQFNCTMNVLNCNQTYVGWALNTNNCNLTIDYELTITEI